MITKISILIAASLLSLTAAANQYKTVKEKKSTKNYEQDISYPRFNKTSVPGYARLNTELKKQLLDGACDEKEAAMAEYPFNYSADVSVVGLNSRYVGLQINYDDFCGGAHPNDGYYFETFSAQTGTLLPIGDEFGLYDYDNPKYNDAKDQAIRLEIAKILIKHLPKDSDTDCFGGNISEQEKLDTLVSFYPSIGGLAKNKTVVLAISPPHVAEVCQFDARVPYDEVKDLILPGSYLIDWLK